MSKLEKITCLCLIAVCIVSVSAIVKHEFFDSNTAGSDLSEYAKSLVGHSEATVPATAWQASQKNVVLLISSRCHFCQESMPLYQELSSLRRGHFSLVVAGVEDSKSLTDYIQQNGVQADSVLQVRSGFVGIRFTLAIFVVNSRGVVEEAFLGKLNSASETQLLHLVAALKPVS